MKTTKMLLIIVMIFTMTLCTSCGTNETEFDFGYNTGYYEGYNDGYNDGCDETSESSYEYGYQEGIKDASEKAYDYLYEEYGIDDDTIIDYCREP